MREWSLLLPHSSSPLPSPASSWPARTKAFNKCNTITCRTCLEEEQQQQWQRQRQQQRQPVGQRNNSIAWLTATPDCRLPTPTLTVDSRLRCAFCSRFFRAAYRAARAPLLFRSRPKTLNAAHVIFLFALQLLLRRQLPLLLRLPLPVALLSSLPLLCLLPQLANGVAGISTRE